MEGFADLLSFAENMPELIRQSHANASQAVLSLMDDRIFVQGLDKNGNKIGDYSTKETLVGASSFLTKKGANKILGSKAKRKNLEWVTVDGRRLAKFPEGYKGIRSADGRQTSTVDLRYSGNLRNDFSSVPNDQGFEMGFFSSESTKKADGNEARFNTVIFCPTEDEINAGIQIGLDAVFR